jgi:glucokinase
VSPVGLGTEAVALGLDVGGTKILGVAIDASGTIVGEVREPTPRRALAGAAGRLEAQDADALAELVESMLVRLEARVATARGGVGAARRAVAAGVGMPGLVDDAGSVRFSPNLPASAGLALGPRLEAALGLPVVVENDATCAAMGELAHGALRGVRHGLVLTLGTGIGGGIVVDGRPYRGAHGFAGEVGHMVVDPGGPPCTCGRRGCLERYASGSGLGRLAREAALGGRLGTVVELAGGDPEAVRAEHVTRAAAEGDPGALEVLGELARWLALGIANLVAVLDPEVVVLGGGLAQAGERLLAPTRAQLAAMLEGAASRPPVPLVLAALEERAGAVGAAVLAFERASRLPAGRPEAGALEADALEAGAFEADADQPDLHPEERLGPKERRGPEEHRGLPRAKPSGA